MSRKVTDNNRSVSVNGSSLNADFSRELDFASQNPLFGMIQDAKLIGSLSEYFIGSKHSQM